MFVMTLEEWEANWSQFATSSKKSVLTGRHRNKSYLPYAFTEHGVTMLASVLRSQKAIQMSIEVVRAFISLKQIVWENRERIGFTVKI